jgi:hypothetical protein
MSRLALALASLPGTGATPSFTLGLKPGLKPGFTPGFKPGFTPGISPMDDAHA